MSYHMLLTSAFSRRRFSTSCCSSTCFVLLACALLQQQTSYHIQGCQAAVLEMEGTRHTEPFSDVSFFASSSCSRSVLVVVSWSWRSWRGAC
jgi:hypothetical protein